MLIFRPGPVRRLISLIGKSFKLPPSMKRLIIANWKMNPATLREARELLVRTKRAARGLTTATVVVCPPVLFLTDLASRLESKTIALGAQDASWETDPGPWTGAVSPGMIGYAGARYVILGHSERRAMGESNDDVRRKLKASLAAGLRVVLCVGERERDPQGFYLEVLKQQLTIALKGAPKTVLRQLFLAYEPVWAISNFNRGADTPDDFLHQAIFLRKILSGLFNREFAQQVPILYGGSADAKNAMGFLTEGQADGLLVGRASLTPETFFPALS